MINDIQNQFDAKRNWITKFIFDGKTYGGWFEPGNRLVDLFIQKCPNLDCVLELGNLEGGYTIQLSTYSKKVVAVEGRDFNIEKSKLILSLYNLKNVELVQANLESYDLQLLGNFDAVFCVGVLYHLPNPWDLIERISKVTSRVYVWTRFANLQTHILNGWGGTYYSEGGINEPLSGMSAYSFWLTFEDLLKLIKNYFPNLDVIEKNDSYCIIYATK